MSVVVKVFNAIDEHNLEALSELIHDDFVYFHDYEMRTKKDWLDGVREGLEMEGKFTDERRILCDTAEYAQTSLHARTGQSSAACSTSGAPCWSRC